MDVKWKMGASTICDQGMSPPFFKEGAIAHWVEQLRFLAHSPFDTLHWQMVGHALIIEFFDRDAVAALMPSIASEAGFELHCLPGTPSSIRTENFDFVMDCEQPTLVYLEPGQWMNSALEGDAGDEFSSLDIGHDEMSAHEYRLRLRDLLRTQVQNRPIIVVTTLANLSQLDVALRTVGCFDRRIRMALPSPEALAMAFVISIGRDSFDSEFHQHINRLGTLLRHEFSELRRRNLVTLALQRIAYIEDRKISFADVVKLAVYGVAEIDTIFQDNGKRHKHAVHEAGHALAIIVDSQFRSYPDYCSVASKDNSHGVTVGSYAEVERTTDDPDFGDLQHRVRVKLAGRAAEHLYFGAGNVSAKGASSDLESATAMAVEMFGRFGMSNDFSSDKGASTNLAVFDDIQNADEKQRLNEMTRIFLSQQYLIVLELLRSHQDLLSSIVDALTNRPFLVAADLKVLVQKWRLSVKEVA